MADSQASKLQENVESFNELREQLRRMGKRPGEFPLVMQWNKRDLPDALAVPEIRNALRLPFGVPPLPGFEASAVQGVGVFETLKDMARRVLGRGSGIPDANDGVRPGSAHCWRLAQRTIRKVEYAGRDAAHIGGFDALRELLIGFLPGGRFRGTGGGQE